MKKNLKIGICFVILLFILSLWKICHADVITPPFPWGEKEIEIPMNTTTTEINNEVSSGNSAEIKSPQQNIATINPTSNLKLQYLIIGGVVTISLVAIAALVITSSKKENVSKNEDDI